MIAPDFHYEEREMTLEEVKAELEDFERLYGMPSEEFYEKWKKGETEWVAESVAWSCLFRAYKALKNRNGNTRNESTEKTAREESDFCIDERDMTFEEVAGALTRYERKYGLTSADFYEKWKKGETDFVTESVDWSLLFEAGQMMNGKTTG